jgi:hypothetical protein
VKYFLGGQRAIGQLESREDFGMANANTLTNFLGILNNQGLPRDQKVTQLMGLFCADRVDAGPPPRTFPCLGITEHGPAFKGSNEVKHFFTQLLTAFPDMTWTQLPHSSQLTSANEIGIQMDVKGTQKGMWFQKPDRHYSMPLSELHAHHIHNRTTDVPAFGVFAFDSGGSFPIRQIAIYLDRYKMMHQLAPDDWTTVHLPRGGF